MVLPKEFGFTPTASEKAFGDVSGQSTIRLGSRSKKEKRILGIFPTTGKDLAGDISKQLKIREETPKVVRVLSSPALTGGLIGLGTGGLGSAIIGAIAGGTAGGLFKESPRATEFAIERLTDPAKVGESVGKFIEDPMGQTKSGVGKITETIKDKPLETAGVLGLTGAGIVGGKKIIEKIRDKRKEVITTLEQQQFQPQLISPAVVSSEPTPIGAKEPQTLEPISPAQAPIDIDIKVNPEIKVRSPKSETFINNIIQNI